MRDVIRWRSAVLGVSVWMLLLGPMASAAAAQYAETPQVFPALDGQMSSATQIGDRLFVAGGFSRLSDPTGNAVIVTPAGTLVPGAVPFFSGTVHQIVPDGLGGFLVVGDFTSVGGLAIARFARVAPDRTVDTRYRVTANGAIRLVALAHGRIYLVGDFDTINGARRRGFAVLDAISGQLSVLGGQFDPGGRRLVALSTSSIGVYISGWNSGVAGRLWGFDAGTGHTLFARDVWVNAIAATSARVYVGGNGFRRPVWAVDPLTGDDTSWTLGMRFEFLSGSYGDYTTVGALLLDEGRLYLGGYFRTSDGRFSLAAADATTGQPLPWRPSPPVSQITRLVRVGHAVVALPIAGAVGSALSRSVHAYDVVNGALQDFNPHTYGGIRTIAVAAEGAVVGGDFNGFGGVSRNGLAAIDLETGAIEPWTVPLPQFSNVAELVTDGTWIFGRTLDSRYLKIDPASGAIVAEHRVSTGDVILTGMRVAGDQLITAVSLRLESAEIGAIAIADWSYRPLPVTLSGGIGQYVTSFDVAGDTIYLAGPFGAVNGQSRPYLAAVHRLTGQVLPWRPSPDAEPRSVRAASGRVWVSGSFQRIGGLRRRGLAEVDPASGLALAWNPDVPVGFAGPPFVDVGRLEVGPDGLLYAVISSYERPTVSGQATPWNIVFSPVTGRRLPWRPAAQGWVAILPDCLLVSNGCLRRAVTPPTDLLVAQTATSVTLQWSLPTAAPGRTGVRLEAGSAEGRSDLLTLDLPATQTSYTAVAPRGSYFARVRSLAGVDASLPTPDVSFAVGPPDVPAAPLDVTAVTEGTRLTLQWQPPSTGAPAAYVFEAGSTQGARNVAALPLAGTATRFTLDTPPGRYWGRLVAVNAAGRSTPGPELLIDVASTVSYCGSRTPEPPAAVEGTVNGALVTVTWQQPYDGVLPTTQRVVAGTAPGLDDLGAIQVPSDATRFSTAAPPGTYYVRVIALNGCGASPYSNEVQIVVR